MAACAPLFITTCVEKLETIWSMEETGVPRFSFQFTLGTSLVTKLESRSNSVCLLSKANVISGANLFMFLNFVSLNRQGEPKIPTSHDYSEMFPDQCL